LTLWEIMDMNYGQFIHSISGHECLVSCVGWRVKTHLEDQSLNL